jgi:hypothetical protein
MFDNPFAGLIPVRVEIRIKVFLAWSESVEVSL